MSIIRNNRNYEKYSEPVPLVSYRQANNQAVTIAGILSPTTFNELSYECLIIDLTKQNNADILMNTKEDFLLVDSLYFNNTDVQNCNITYILGICKKKEISCVFWDMGNHDFLYENIDLVKQFDTVFTINESYIDDYKQALHHENVFYLPLAVQPRIYNPIERNIMNKDESISSKSNIELNRVLGSIHKIYSIAFKNTAQDELTSIPKELFQSLAIGTTMISPYFKILEEFFPEIIKLYQSNEEKTELLNPLLKDKDAIDKLSVLGQRNVFHSHTYTNRLNTILETIGLSSKIPQIPGVTMVTATNRLDSMETVFANYENQNYANKELIVVLNNNKIDLEEWQNKAKQYDKVKVFQIDEKQPLGRCLNYAIDNSNYPYFSKCDDDNYYAPYFLSDLMNAFQYTNAQIVGKLNYYCYLEGCKTLAMICPNMEHRYVNMLSGSALIIAREVFEKVRFSDKPAGSDSVFLKECISKGVLMYSADRFNYVYKRHKSQANHTFKMRDDVFLKSCKVVDITDDFVARVTV